MRATGGHIAWGGEVMWHHSPFSTPLCQERSIWTVRCSSTRWFGCLLSLNRVRAQAQSPILTPAEITAIRESSAAQENLKKAVELMSGFCQRSDHWLTRYRHRKGGQIRFGRFRACGCAHGKLRAILRCGTHIAQQENAMAKSSETKRPRSKETKAGEIHATNREILCWYHIHAAVDFEHDTRKFKE